MSEPEDQWWLSRGGERFGPVTFEQVVEAAKAGRLEPRKDMLFGGDLKDWTPAGQVEGVFEKAETEDGSGSQPGSSSSALADGGEHSPHEVPADLHLPGAGRLGWFLGVTVLPVILVLGLGAAMPKLAPLVGETYAPWLPFIFLLVPLLVVIITVKRFQNLAMSGWWTLLLLVPLVNLWLQARLFAYPSGYGYTKKLDTPGKVLATLYWLAIAAWVAGSIAVVALGAGEAFNDARFQEQLQELKNRIEEMQQAPQPGGEP